MKQIKDVEKLINKIKTDDFIISGGHFINEKTLLGWIDSLAVEVPEAEPDGASAIIKCLAKLLQMPRNNMSEREEDAMLNDVVDAKLELRQLQADNAALKKTVDEIAALNEKMNDEAISIERRHKGALRTLANQLVENEIVPTMYDPEYENKSWADCWIFHTLANPTEEVEG